MKTITLTCALTELLQGLSRVRNSCRQLTRMEPCLSMPVTQSSSLNYMQKNLHSVNVLYLTVLSLATSYNSALFLTHSSTHLADRLTRKFHSLADTHTHSSVSIVTRPHRAAATEKGREQMSVCQSCCSTARYLSTLLLHLPVQITVRQVSVRSHSTVRDVFVVIFRN